jgi:hypothetical protein
MEIGFLEYVVSLEEIYWEYFMDIGDID